MKEILQKISFIQTKNVISSEGSKDLSKCWRISIIFVTIYHLTFFVQMKKRFAAAWILSRAKVLNTSHVLFRNLRCYLIKSI